MCHCPPTALTRSESASSCLTSWTPSSAGSSAVITEARASTFASYSASVLGAPSPLRGSIRFSRFQVPTSMPNPFRKAYDGRW